MPDIIKWAINNVWEARAGGRLEHCVPFAIWQRQWEVCDLAGDRARSREIAGKAACLAGRDNRYGIASLLFDCQVGIYSAEYSKALQLAEEALDISKRTEDDSRLAEIYGLISQAQQYLSVYEKAVEYRLLAAGIYEASKDEASLGNCWSSLGLIYWKTGQYPQALSYLTKAREIFEGNRDQRSMAMVLTNTANVLLATDEAGQAQEYYLQALDICRRIGDSAKQSTVHNNLGAILFRRADYSGALEHYSLGLKIDETLGNLTGQASKLSNMAVMQAERGHHDQALANFEKALKIDRTTGNQDGQMRKLGNLATLYAIKGDYSKAIVHMDQALEICQKINSRSYYGYFISQKVGYLGNIKDYQAAKAIGAEAIELTKSSGNLSQLATLYSTLADIYRDTGETGQAFEYSSQAIEIIKNHELFEVYKENNYFTHCLVLEKQGNQSEADKYLDLAYNEVQEKAGNIKDEKEKAGFLNQNKTIAAIVGKWESSHPKEK